MVADLNNEREVKNPKYKANIASLNTLALAYATKDDIVVPRSSPWY
jgi:palmitoyl-protein thioesterase